jgi:hypothetical protein
MTEEKDWFDEYTENYVAAPIEKMNPLVEMTKNNRKYTR